MKNLYLFSSFILIGIYFITLWTLDISVAAINTPNTVLIGLWGEVNNPWLKYHQALHLNIIVFFLLTASLMMYKIGGKRNE